MNKTLNNIFSKHGIIIEKDEEEEPLTFSSLTFISIIIEIEQVFKISVPDEYLNIERLITFKDFNTMIKGQINMRR